MARGDACSGCVRSGPCGVYWAAVAESFKELLPQYGYIVNNRVCSLR